MRKFYQRLLLGALLALLLPLAACGKSKPVTTDLAIPAPEITDDLKMVPVQLGKIKTNVLAYRVSDGSVRTALNISQVCYPSGKGFYVQEGQDLVCQNCGQRVALETIGLPGQGGCHPVAIPAASRTEADGNVVIPAAVLEEFRQLIETWQ
ncbi:MAG: DUF2318 domain-containing protein [Oscillospiraceae bacterium]|nr:DUF2318 domain-containing protein [Oscillospiraceae bacterium]